MTNYQKLGGLKQKKLFFFIVLQAKGPKSGYWQSPTPCEVCEGKAIPASPSFWWLQAFLCSSLTTSVFHLFQENFNYLLNSFMMTATNPIQITLTPDLSQCCCQSPFLIQVAILLVLNTTSDYLYILDILAIMLRYPRSPLYLLF